MPSDHADAVARDDRPDPDRYTAPDNGQHSSNPAEPWDREDSVLVALKKETALWSKIRYRVRWAFNSLIRLRGSPEAIAWGLALGLFIGMSPTVGFQMMIAVPLATALRGNPAAAAAGVWLTNPFTIPFLYGLNYWIGAKILGYHIQETFGGNLTFEMLLQSGNHVWWSLVLGGIITGGICAAVAYYPTLIMVRAGRASIIRRLERRRARKQARQQREQTES